MKFGVAAVVLMWLDSEFVKRFAQAFACPFGLYRLVAIIFSEGILIDSVSKFPSLKLPSSSISSNCRLEWIKNPHPPLAIFRCPRLA